MKSSNITIEFIEDPEKYWNIIKLMSEIWGIIDTAEIVPAHMMRAIADNGGLVLVAYDTKGEPVGFVLGILAMNNKGKLYHYSHMLGVKKEYRGTGVAVKLKLAQRDFAIKQGLDLIMWTYDPQQGLNAKFNFTKLGVICRKFYRNYYGILRDEINRGLVSDRFKVEWWIKSRRVVKRIEGSLPSPTMNDIKDMVKPIVKTERIAPGIRRVKEVDLTAESDLLLVEIPADVNKIRDYSIDLANDWRLKLRPVFETYFSRGYIAVDFISSIVQGERRNYYILWKTSLKEVLDGELPWR